MARQPGIAPEVAPAARPKSESGGVGGLKLDFDIDGVRYQEACDGDERPKAIPAGAEARTRAG